MTEKQIALIDYLKTNPFVLAPMAGITDHPFRSFMRKMGAGVVVSELVSATGIEYKSERTMSLLSFDDTQRPVGLQLFGEDPEIMAKGAQVVEGLGAEFVDVNFGCPVPKVVKKGAGSAMMKDLPAMAKMLGAMVKAVKIPVTIKIRTGWDSNLRNASDVCDLAYNEGITWVSIHGRTRAQGYSGQADWDFIGEVKAKSKIPIIGNGDILSAEKAIQRLKEAGVDGVMIGRGALKNPYIFRESKALLNGGTFDRTERNFLECYDALHGLIREHCPERILLIQLKKFASWFATGYPGASAFRRNLFQSKSSDETILLSHKFFSEIQIYQQEDTSQEDFLMGGHG